MSSTELCQSEIVLTSHATFSMCIGGKNNMHVHVIYIYRDVIGYRVNIAEQYMFHIYAVPLSLNQPFSRYGSQLAHFMEVEYCHFTH